MCFLRSKKHQTSACEPMLKVCPQTLSLLSPASIRLPSAVCLGGFLLLLPELPRNKIDRYERKHDPNIPNA